MGSQQTKHSEDETLELLYQFAGSLKEQERMTQNREMYIPLINSSQSGSNNANILISKNSKKAYLQDLRIDQIHKNLYLDLHIILPSTDFMSIMFIAMDENGKIEKVAVYNHKASKRNSHQVFHIGAQVQIINPYYKNAQDGYPLIRIDDPKTISVKPTDQDQFFKGLLKLTNHLLPLDQGIAKSLLQHAESNPSLKGAKLDSLKILVSNYQPSQTQSQEPKQPQQPYWNGHHIQMPDFQNESPQDMIDENQMKEFQDMMAENVQIYPLFIRACQMSLNKPQVAINSFQSILKQTQKYAVIYFNCGEIAFQQGQYALAESMMRDYLKLHEKKNFVYSKLYSFAHYHIGVSLQYQQKNLKEAEFYLQKAVSLDQKSLVFSQALSKFYYEMNQYDKSAQFSQVVIDQFEKQAQKFSPNSQTYLNDIVELSRIYHIQMCAAKKSKNMEGLFTSAENLSKLDDLNFEFIIGELNEVIMSDEYSFEEKQKLCELMSKSEEFEVLLALQQKDFNLKLKCHNEIQKKYQIEAIQPPVFQQDEQKQLSADELAQNQQLLEENIDQQLIHLILPERADIPQKLEFEEAMTKRKNRNRKQTIDQFRQKAEEKKQKNSGYITDMQYFNQIMLSSSQRRSNFRTKYRKRSFVKQLRRVSLLLNIIHQESKLYNKRMEKSYLNSRQWVRETDSFVRRR
ncbi:unnamed protein product [Paramecium sonneborni]|uniref:Tetratricopeptide repeat protein n=1 Tax=Paramecium sonneborni TaxID=65129 RepID=A0A8S1PHH8_9CILI|nr:unnamed protein product [Paramecium sonneborni]